ncbi:flavoprotein [Nocardia sp. NPDC059228]|uniref:flavoprotein n=1 Tax=Nocardia sp. NPDC059228 TaxID=3346777 RepID=UPI00367A8980
MSWADPVGAHRYQVSPCCARSPNPRRWRHIWSSRTERGAAASWRPAARSRTSRCWPTSSTTPAHLSASISSESFQALGLAVMPCSARTRGGGHRKQRQPADPAADVVLKERRPLVLAVRVAPLNLIHVRSRAEPGPCTQG